MKLAAIALLIYSALVLGGGLVAFVSTKSIGSLVASVVISAIVIYLAYR
ncbi:MAG: TMEM14 family protein, partial [bacterium]